MGTYLVLLASACGTTVVSSAQEGVSSGEGRQHVVRLQYRQSGFDLDANYPVDGVEVVFKKEPAYKGDALIRGLLPFTRNVGRCMGYVYDEWANTLYVDVNRDWDLTDDAHGVFEGRYITQRAPLQLATLHEGVTIPFGVHVSFISARGAGPAQCRTEVLSGWLGRMPLGGREWHVGVVDNMDAVLDGDDRLVLKPIRDETEAEPKEFAQEYQGPSNMPFPKLLFLLGRSYELTYAFEANAQAADLVVTFTEIECRTGNLRIEGEFIHALQLVGGPVENRSLALLEEPRDVVRIPVGTYERRRVFVGDESRSHLYAAGIEGDVEVREGETATLVTGAPLKVHVEASPHRGYLRMSHTVRGADGHVYDIARGSDWNERVSSRRKKYPELTARFSIYEGLAPLASGTFEYG